MKRPGICQQDHLTFVALQQGCHLLLRCIQADQPQDGSFQQQLISAHQPAGQIKHESTSACAAPIRARLDLWGFTASLGLTASQHVTARGKQLRYKPARCALLQFPQLDILQQSLNVHHSCANPKYKSRLGRASVPCCLALPAYHVSCMTSTSCSTEGSGPWHCAAAVRALPLTLKHLAASM